MNLLYLFKEQQVIKIKGPCPIPALLKETKGDHLVLKPVVQEKQPKLREGRRLSQTQGAGVWERVKRNPAHKALSTVPDPPAVRLDIRWLSSSSQDRCSPVPSARWPQAALATVQGDHSPLPFLPLTLAGAWVQVQGRHCGSLTGHLAWDPSQEQNEVWCFHLCSIPAWMGEPLNSCLSQTEKGLPLSYHVSYQSPACNPVQPPLAATARTRHAARGGCWERSAPSPSSRQT